jgi:hypothetical protein
MILTHTKQDMDINMKRVAKLTKGDIVFYTALPNIAFAIEFGWTYEIVEVSEEIELVDSLSIIESN